MQVSIIITAYNVEKCIERAVRSAINQTHKDIEVVIVEDCSTDNTLAVCKRLANEHYNIRLVEHPYNMGAGMARRDGINAATGDYVLTLDADDWLDQDFVSTLADTAEQTGAEIVGGGVTYHGKDVLQAEDNGSLVLVGVDKVRNHFNEKVVFMNNKIIARRLCNLVPYCHRRFIEDTPTIIPMLYHANKVVYVPHCGYHYWLNDASLTHTADEVKYLLYRFLCLIDLIAFFADKEDEYRALFPSSSVQPFIADLKKVPPHLLNRYDDVNRELAFALLRIININPKGV